MVEKINPLILGFGVLFLPLTGKGLHCYIFHNKELTDKQDSCCCSAYFSSCHRTALDADLLDDPHTFHYNDYFVIRGICTCLGVSDDPMFLWLSSNSCPLNFLLVRSHQAEIINVKHLIQGRNNVTRVRVEPRPFDQGRRKNDALTHSTTLTTLVCLSLVSMHLV